MSDTGSKAGPSPRGGALRGNRRSPPGAGGVRGSRTTFIAGNSAQRAARKAREKILRAAAENLGTRAEELDLRRGHVVRDDSGERLVALPRLLPPPRCAEK